MARNLTRQETIVFAVVTLAGLAVTMFALLPGKARDRSGDAVGMCQEYVKRRLKSPGSARFSGSEETLREIDGIDFKITGWVDSQNSFGALLRAHFVCKVTPTTGNVWKLDDLAID